MVVIIPKLMKIWKSHLVNAKFIIRINNDYIVLIDNTDEIGWETSAAYDKRLKENKPKEYDLREENSILKEVASLESFPSSQLDPVAQMSFKRQIGEAIAFNIEYDYISATQMLISAQDFIRLRSQEKSREWYLFATFVASLPFLITGASLWVFRKWSIHEFGLDANWLFLSTCAGAIGALFSVITRTGKIKFDHSSGKKLHELEGGSRVVAGAIAGLLVALAIRSEIVFAAFSSAERMHELMLFGALVGGAAERLATSIISKFGAPPISSTLSNEASLNLTRP